RRDVGTRVAAGSSMTALGSAAAAPGTAGSAVPGIVPGVVAPGAGMPELAPGLASGGTVMGPPKSDPAGLVVPAVLPAAFGTAAGPNTGVASPEPASPEQADARKSPPSTAATLAVRWADGWDIVRRLRSSEG